MNTFLRHQPFNVVRKRRPNVMPNLQVPGVRFAPALMSYAGWFRLLKAQPIATPTAWTPRSRAGLAAGGVLGELWLAAFMWMTRVVEARQTALTGTISSRRHITPTLPNHRGPSHGSPPANVLFDGNRRLRR